MNTAEITIRSIQHYLYCPHRWGLLEIDKAWAENIFVTKANLMHERVHDPERNYTSRGKKVFTSVPVYNDQEKYNLYGVTDCLELTESSSGTAINESGEKYEKSFQFLHKGIQWAIKHKLRVVVDLHIIRAHYFNAGMEGGTNTLWTDAKAQTHFLSLWEELSAELNGYDTHMLAYEIMNEPTAPDHEDWNKLIQRAYDQIRSLEKKRVLVIGSNLWQGVGTFQYLKVPANDPNIILSCHFYEPFILSHYKASWTEFKDITVPVHYPGYLITKEDYEALPEAEQKQVARWLKEWDKSTLHGYLIQAKKKADELGLNLYCGEFGIYRVAPRADAYRWYKDVIEVFDELNMAWCHWDYKGGYTIFNEDGKVDSELMKAIGLQAH